MPKRKKERDDNGRKVLINSSSVAEEAFSYHQHVQIHIHTYFYGCRPATELTNMPSSDDTVLLLVIDRVTTAFLQQITRQPNYVPAQSPLL